MPLLTTMRDRPLASMTLLALSTTWLLKVLRRLAKATAPGQDVPWARGWMPVFGHVATLLKYAKDNNKLAAGRMALGIRAEEGHDLFQIEVMGMRMCFVTNLDAVEEIITNDPHRFTKDFANVPSFKFVKELFGDGLFFASTDSESWRVPHNILKAPFSINGMKAIMPMMSEQADELVKCLKREVGIGGVCHIDHWVTKMAFETIAVCATGTSFGSWDDAQDSPFIKAMNNVISGVAPLAKTGVPAFLWSIVFPKTVSQIRADGKLVRDTCIEVIRKRRAGETHTASARKDIMDMMLNDTDPKSGKKMTEEQIVDNVLTFLFAGQDSTAAAMATLLCYLCAYPKCKEKLVQEIDSVVGSGELEWAHLSQMHYLDWCVKEAMRLVPPAGGVARNANGDQLLQGKWRIPAGTMCLVGIMALHYDEALWGKDAMEFRPERWENGPPHKYAFIPFAVGPRSCTGREFTLIEQKVTFVKLFQNFDFRRPDNVKPEPGYTTLKKENQTMVPFIDMDVETKTVSAFVGLFSALELLERKKL